MKTRHWLLAALLVLLGWALLPRSWSPSFKGPETSVSRRKTTRVESPSGAGADERCLQSRDPFTFIVDDRTFEPGEYLFSSASSYRGLIFRTAGNRFVVPAFRNSPARENSQPELLFHKYGDLYFLSEVFLGPGLDGLKLSECRMEKEMVLTTWKLERVVP